MVNKYSYYVIGLVAMAMMLVLSACSGPGSTQKPNQVGAPPTKIST